MLRCLLALLVVWLCCASAASAASLEALETIQQMIGENRLDKARKLLDEVLEDSPQDTNALLLNSTLYLLEAKPGKARDVLEDNRSVLEQDPVYHNNLAYIYFASKDDKKAIKALEQGLEQNKAYAALYENLTTIYAYKAKQAYEKAIKEGGEQDNALPNLKLVKQMTFASPVAVTSASTPIKPPPPPPAVDTKMARSEAENLIKGWAKAWSEQDVDTYLSFYADDFVTTPGMSLKNWRQYRRERLKAPSFIQVAVRNFDIVIASDASLASVHFLQHYRSNTFDDKIIKHMTLVRKNEQWKIRSENVSD